MTLAFNTSVVHPASIDDIIIRTDTTEVFTLAGASNSIIYRYQPDGTLLANSIALTFRHNNLAAITNGFVGACGANTRLSIYNIAFNTTSQFAGAAGYVGVPFTKGQQCAGANDTWFVLNNAADTIFKCNSSGTNSLLSARYIGNTSTHRASTIIHKNDTTDNFIIGTSNGRIIEIDNTAEVVWQYDLPKTKIWNQYTQNQGFSSFIWSFHYYQGYLAVGLVDGQVWLVHHPTGEVLQKIKPFNGFTINSHGAVLSKEGGLAAIGTSHSTIGDGGMIAEFDLLRTPIRTPGYCLHQSLGTIFSIVIASGNKVWAGDGTTARIYDLTGVRTVTEATMSLDDGGPVQGRVIVMSDDGTPGNAEVIFDTPVAAGGSVVPRPSTDVLRVFSTGEGTHKKFDIRRN